jgi:hypothetical protein
MRADASSEIDGIKDSALSQIRDIERAINTAIIEVNIANGGAQESELPPPASALSAFPDPVCNKPDVALLAPAKGKRTASLQALDRYELQRRAYEPCMSSYIAQAKSEILRVKAYAELACKRITDDVNPRITEINNAVIQAVAEAVKASGERDARVSAFHSPVTAQGLDPAAYQPGGRGPIAFQAPQPGTENVTVTGDRLPQSADMPTGVGDPDAISCRAPQALTDSRLMGPEICKHNRDWAKLYKDGWNISPDGSHLVAAEKWLTLHPQTCISHNTISSNGAPEVNTFCNQGDRY